MTVKQIVEITDHSSDGHDRLHQQYKDPGGTLSVPSIGPDLVTGWRAILNAFILPSQEFETIANKMLNERGIGNAEGVNLDRIGQIVGIGRGGSSDEDYANLIVGQIAANNSDSTARDLLGIATIILGDNLRSLTLVESFPAKALIDYISEIYFTIDETNNYLEVQTDGGGVSPLLPVTLTQGSYFPYELASIVSGQIETAWGEPIGVTFTSLREFQFEVGTVPNLPDPTITFRSAGPLYGFAVDQVISSTVTGSPVAGPNTDEIAVQDSLEQAKAAGVDISSQSVPPGTFFGFSNDNDSLGWSSSFDTFFTISAPGTNFTLNEWQDNTYKFSQSFQTLNSAGQITEVAWELNTGVGNPTGLIRMAIYDFTYDPPAYYTTFTYDAGPLDDSRRIYMDGNGTTDISLALVFPSGTHWPFLTESNDFRLQGGTLGVVDENGDDWVLVGISNIFSNFATVGNVTTVFLDLRSSGTTAAGLTKNGTPETLDNMFTMFPEYNEANKAAYDANNPSGLFKGEAARDPDEGSLLGASDSVEISSLSLPALQPFTFSTTVPITPDTKYWMTLELDGAGFMDLNNYIEIKGAAGGTSYPDGDYYVFDGVDWGTGLGDTEFQITVNGEPLILGGGIYTSILTF